MTHLKHTSFDFLCFLLLLIIYMTYLQIPLNEVVEPPDFEEIVLQNQPFNENDPNSKMLEFPDDDIEVTTIPRQCRTVKPCFPKDTG